MDTIPTTRPARGDRMRFVVAVTSVVALMALTVAGLALMVGNGTESVSQGGTETFDVTMKEFSYDPSTIEVAPGTRGDRADVRAR